MLQAVGHRVVVRPDVIERKTEGGIVLPEDIASQHDSKQVTGTVVSIGPTCWKGYGDGEPWVNVGDRIVFAKYVAFVYAGKDKEKLWIINDGDVLGLETESGGGSL